MLTEQHKHQHNKEITQVTVDVTVFINNIVQNNPNISANTKKGVASTTALFSSLQNGNLNASQLVDTSKLSASDQANLAKFNAVAGSITSGGGISGLGGGLGGSIATGGVGSLNPSQFVDTSKLSPSDQANLAAFNKGVSTLNAVANGGDPTALLGGVTGGIAANIKANIGTSANSQQTTSKSKNIGPENAAKEQFDKGANRILLEQGDAPKGIPLLKIKDGIPTLLQSEVKALMCQIAYMESDWNTTYLEGQWYGRYAAHVKTLRSYGYMFSGNTGFKGKDGIKTELDFIYDNNVQDRLMETYIKDQYKALIKNGAIRTGDSKANIAGMIAVSYQFQDANISLAAISQLTSSLSGIAGSAAGIDISGLTGAATGTSSNMTNTLTSAQLAVGQSQSIGQSGAAMSAASAGISNASATGGISSNAAIVTGVLIAAGMAGDPVATVAAVAAIAIAAKAASANTNTKSNVTSTTSGKANTNPKTASIPASVKAAIAATVSGIKDQAALVAAKLDVAGLKSAADDMTTSIPAGAALEWRVKGSRVDSRKRPGSLFYNAGKYAIQALGADVPPDKPADTTPPAASNNTPPPTVTI